MFSLLFQSLTVTYLQLFCVLLMTGSGTKSLMKPSLFQSLTVISLCRAYINLITSESDQESSENSDSDLQRAIERSLADELEYV